MKYSKFLIWKYFNIWKLKRLTFLENSGSREKYMILKTRRDFDFLLICNDIQSSYIAKEADILPGDDEHPATLTPLSPQTQKKLPPPQLRGRCLMAKVFPSPKLRDNQGPAPEC